MKLLTGILLTLVLAAVVQAQDVKLPFSVPENTNLLPETALVETSQGNFEVRFYRDDAPITVRNFEYLGRKGFYKGLTFHRYVEGFVIQGGDPEGTGKGGPGYRIPPELRDIKHHAGTLGMAMLPASANPERLSNGSQFYITLADAPHLDGLFSVFAEVTSGMEVVRRLRQGDRILEIRFPR
ncbi:MAG: peptidylprolyl isomerase [bacterium]|nr:peptidylprolyl isomerase [bacterium]